MNPAAFLHKQLSYFVGTPEERRIFLFRTPSPASPMFLHERAQIMLRRTEVLAWVFMILVPLWIVVDALAFPPEVVSTLMMGRLVATFSLGMLLIVSLVLVERASWLTSYLTLLGLMAIPAIFEIYAQPVFTAWQQHGGPVTGMQAAAISLYQQLPVIYISGLALFPMTLLESLPIALSIAAMVAVVDMGGQRLDAMHASQWTGLWVVLVTGGSAVLSGVLQFNLLWQNHRLEDYDGRTGLMKRTAALELLQLYWNRREQKPQHMAVGMIALPAGPEAARQNGTGHDPVAKAAALFHRQLPPGMQAVCWSECHLGLVAIDCDPAALEKVLGTIGAEIGAVPGDRPGFVVAERLSDHSVSPLNLLGMAEQRLNKEKAIREGTRCC